MAVMRSASAAPRPILEIDDSVTVTMTATRAPMSLKDLEDFITVIRARGGEDFQAVTWSHGNDGTMGGQWILKLSAKIGWNVVLPEEEK